MTTVETDRLRRLLAAFRDRHAVPALGAAVITRSGALDLSVVGDRQRGGADPATVDDQWHIGSCGKAITAALYARLVEHGDTEWDTPIVEVFDDLSGDLDPGWAGVTIEEVLVCRSGMRADLSASEMLHAYDDTTPSTEQRTRATVSALAQPPSGRNEFRYSNLGYIVVGAAIDRLTGIPYEEALRIHLLDPLGITSAGFGPPPDIWGHAGKTRLRNLIVGKGAPTPPDNPRSDNPTVMTPAGRLHLTLADWAKFQHLILNRGHDLLEPGTVSRLLTAPAGKGTGMAMGWAPATKLDNASHGMQGSNTYWAATALIDAIDRAHRHGRDQRRTHARHAANCPARQRDPRAKPLSNHQLGLRQRSVSLARS